jgi:hypothetical protein
MQTEMMHGDVIAGASTYDELDHELVDAGMSGYRTRDGDGEPVADDSGWDWTTDGEELADEHMRRLRDVIERPDADVLADVQRMLALECLVPTTVCVHVCDGIVTLTGTVGADRERECAKYMAGLVPGVFGVSDEIDCAATPATTDSSDEASAVAA